MKYKIVKVLEENEKIFVIWGYPDFLGITIKHKP